MLDDEINLFIRKVNDIVEFFNDMEPSRFSNKSILSRTIRESNIKLSDCDIRDTEKIIKYTQFILDNLKKLYN